mgnify:CR=1
ILALPRPPVQKSAFLGWPESDDLPFCAFCYPTYLDSLALMTVLSL